MTPNGRRRQRTGGAVLNEREVAKIKRMLLNGHSPREIAEAFDVSPETIRRIGREEAWRWVEPLGLDGEPVVEKTDEQMAREAAASLVKLRGMMEAETGEGSAGLDRLLAETNEALERQKELVEFIGKSSEE